MLKSIILIPSRLAATRLPNKPLLKIKGKSLISLVYKNAANFKAGDVYVVTGDKKILSNVKKEGGKAILTKKKHKTGTDRIYEAVNKIKNKDIELKEIRGNIETRIKKLRNEDYDAIILAKAGLMCLDSKNFITQEFETSDFIPSAGQGIVVVQCRKDDKDIIDLIENINDENSRICARAERKVLEILSGDCSTPVGVISFLKDDKIKIAAELFSVDGKKRYYVDLTKEKKFYIELGIEIGKILKKESKGSYKI